MRFLPLTLAAGVLWSGCATMASRDDYADYRAVRLAEEPRDRSQATAEYLREHPQGRWANELRPQHVAAEEGLYEANKSDGDGLRYYLSVYPEGQYAEQARARLTALSTVQSSRAEAAETDRQVNRERRQEALAERRQWASDAITYWTRILLGVQQWGRPIGDVASANEAFDEAFRGRPAARCSATECIKFYELEFAIPVPGQTQMQRHMRLLLRLRFEGDDRRLVRAEMLMPDRGFSRWFELENTQLVETADPDQRQATIDWALERLIPLVREVAPQAEAVDVVPEPVDPPTIGQSGEAPTATASDELVLPLALQGLKIAGRDRSTLQVVVFAAADEDTGPAYDGFFIQRIEAE